LDPLDSLGASKILLFFNEGSNLDVALYRDDINALTPIGSTINPVVAKAFKMTKNQFSRFIFY
jgi:hypothetical protein